MLVLNSFLRQGRVMALQSKGVCLFSFVGACWNTLLLRNIALLCQREILANKYPCVYSLLQKALVLFSKLFFLVHYSYSPLNSSIPYYSAVSKLGSTAALKDITLICHLNEISKKTSIIVLYMYLRTKYKQK